MKLFKFLFKALLVVFALVGIVVVASIFLGDDEEELFASDSGYYINADDEGEEYAASWDSFLPETDFSDYISSLFGGGDWNDDSAYDWSDYEYTADNYQYDDSDFDNYDYYKPVSVSGSTNLTFTPQTSGNTSVQMSVDAEGNLQINRQLRSENKAMGAPGTWTIFVYLCGSDLESGSGLASGDMDEMLKAATGSNVRFVVETGGSKKWSNGSSKNKLQRYVICNGKKTLVNESNQASMANPSTLANFLKWGVSTYPAEKMGLILWNHGGGSVSGVCFDENNSYDSLSLRDLDAALLSVSQTMTDKFEFIGFDACLMGTLETANICATYARYMYGSEETEPGYGWNYKAIGNYLGKASDTNGAKLGKIVADSFYSMCKEIGSESDATFSIINLGYIDDLMVSFNKYALNLYNSTADSSIRSYVARNVNNADNFGGNNKSEGYTNMVDLAGLVDAGSKYADGASKVLEAIDNAVIYKVNGSGHKKACGLALYYPLKIQSSSELKTFSEISVSPYYLAYVDRSAQNNVASRSAPGSAVASNVSYSSSSVIDSWGSYSYAGDSGDDSYYYDDYSDYYDYYDDFEATGDSDYITFDVEPSLDEDGNFWFVLDEDGLTYTESVSAIVYQLSYDEEDLIELGQVADLYMDWETGEFVDGFDGYWFSLPDGQNLAVYIVEEGDGYDVYTSPVRVNGKDTNLRILHNYEKDKIAITGLWGGIDENGMASKITGHLKKGDRIVPLYNAYALESDDEYEYYGEEYVFDGIPQINYELLEDGIYFYGFEIDDIFGDYYTSDFVTFEVDGDEVYFYED